MNYYEIKKNDIANGPGVRVSIFICGCHQNPKCPGCFNEEIWNPNSGKLFTEASKLELFSHLDKDYIEGITILGGDPMAPYNQVEITSLLKEINFSFPKKTVWFYTGDLWETILENSLHNSTIKELIHCIDILVDGKFEKEKYSPKLKFKGSENQRLIDVKQSLFKKEIILYK